jgi:hypothetical protein
VSVRQREGRRERERERAMERYTQTHTHTHLQLRGEMLQDEVSEVENALPARQGRVPKWVPGPGFCLLSRSFHGGFNAVNGQMSCKSRLV